VASREVVYGRVTVLAFTSQGVVWKPGASTTEVGHREIFGFPTKES
jgi:hypothetical protein